MKGSEIVAQHRKVTSTAKEQAAQLDRGRDWRMTEEQEVPPQFTLKDGDKVDARSTLILLQRLRTMMEVHRDRFQSLLALAQERPADASPDHLDQLKAGGFLDATGATAPDVKRFIRNSYRETSEGAVLTSPSHLNIEGDLAEYERVNAQLDQKVRNFLSSPDDKGRH
jgi:hypothetical protein